MNHSVSHRNQTKHQAVAVAVALLIFVALLPAGVAGAGTAPTPPDPSVTHSPTPLCGLSDAATGRHIPDTAGPKEVAPAHEWLEERADAVAILAEELEAWRWSILGSVADHDQQRMVVVVDPASNSMGELHRSLTARLKGTGGLRVHLVPGCRPLQELNELVEEIASMEWLGEWGGPLPTDAKTVLFSVGIDAATSTVEVGLSESIADAEDYLRERYSQRIQFLTYKSMGRMNDGSPHYGGARITAEATGKDCTAGFAVDRPGGRWMVTALHCNTGNTTGKFYSGSKYFGEAVPDPNAPPNSTTFSSVGDLLLIGDGVDQYSRVIHVDPCSPCTRLVNDKRSIPSFGITNYCVSGATTKAKCSLTLIGNTLLCAGGGCWTAWKARRPGVTVVDHGDSGGPVYYRNGSTTARIYGMIIGALEEEGLPGDTVLFTDVGTIEEELDVTVATTCCNGSSW